MVFRELLITYVAKSGLFQGSYEEFVQSLGYVVAIGIVE